MRLATMQGPQAHPFQPIPAFKFNANGIHHDVFMHAGNQAISLSIICICKKRGTYDLCSLHRKLITFQSKQKHLIKLVLDL